MGEKRWLQKLTKVSHKPFTSPSFHPPLFIRRERGEHRCRSTVQILVYWNAFERDFCVQYSSKTVGIFYWSRSVSDERQILGKKMLRMPHACKKENKYAKSI
jgi:hypothetical protein